jgi:hypothetical protein
MPAHNSLKKIARKEFILFVLLFLAGLLFLPLLIYFIGKSIFGTYDGSGFATFYGTLHSEFRAGEPVVWFLMLSPYIVWQVFRLSIWAFRRPSSGASQVGG